MAKTNAVRMLEQAGVDFRAADYSFDEESMDAVSVAHALGVEPERVFKTLVTHDGRAEHYVFCLPGSAQLDLKKAARAARVRRIAMIRVGDLQPVTGYVHGGCSPIGMKRLLPTWFDESAALFETIFLSAGARGLQVEVAARDVITLLGAAVADLTV